MKNIISWVEIPASDMKRAVTFYNALLNLELEILDFGEEKMACFPNDEGAISQAPGFTPCENGVLVSLNMGDQLDEALEKVEALGGKVLRTKTKIEAEGRGYFAQFLDTEGNQLGLYGDV
jgi:predicted enzyme related to lactoylglutathione lyase